MPKELNLQLFIKGKSARFTWNDGKAHSQSQLCTIRRNIKNSSKFIWQSWKRQELTKKSRQADANIDYNILANLLLASSSESTKLVVSMSLLMTEDVPGSKAGRRWRSDLLWPWSRRAKSATNINTNTYYWNKPLSSIEPQIFCTHSHT